MAVKTKKSRTIVAVVVIIVLLIGLVATSYLLQNGVFQLHSNASTPDLSHPSVDAAGPTFETDAEAKLFEGRKFNPSDAPLAQKYMRDYERINLKPVVIPITQPKQEPLTSGSYYVTPILFIPSDKVENPAYSAGISSTFDLLRRWYSGALEKKTGYTFDVSSMEIYHAPNNFEYYKCPNHVSPCDNYDGVWGNVQVELESAGYQLWSPGRIFVVFVEGAGGWAGGLCAGNNCNSWPPGGPPGTSGVVVLGDWNLDGISGLINDECWGYYGSSCSKSPQQGATGHELGHAFGLWHPDSSSNYSTSIMGAWWSFPYVTFLHEDGNDQQALMWASDFVHTQACKTKAWSLDSVIPTSVVRNTKFTASFHFLNYGWCKWDTKDIKLRIIKDNVWTKQMVQFKQVIYPAQDYWFYANLISPATSGVYASDWRLQENGLWFGPTVGRDIRVKKQ